MYSWITRRAGAGNRGERHIRLIVGAERPEALCVRLRIVQAVLRQTPSATAWSSSAVIPASIKACRSFAIFADCLAFLRDKLDDPGLRIAGMAFRTFVFPDSMCALDAHSYIRCDASPASLYLGKSNNRT